MVAHACDPSTWSKGFKFKGSLRKTLRLKAAWVTKPDTVSKQNQNLKQRLGAGLASYRSVHPHSSPQLLDTQQFTEGMLISNLI